MEKIKRNSEGEEETAKKPTLIYQVGKVYKEERIGSINNKI